MREKLFSVGLKDLKMEVFRAGGKGGQHANKNSTGVRLRHPESGAVGESREFKSQHQNKAAAFSRLASSPEMTRWIKKKSAEMMLTASEKAAAERDLAIKINRMTSDENLKYEVHNEDGEWIEVESIE